MYNDVILADLAYWSGGKLSGQDALRVQAICTDSRTLQSGDVFLALKGESFDGHKFLEEAVKRGASALITEKPVAATIPTLVVSNTLQAMVLIAKAIRRKFSGPVIAITGSAGKSSTKEMTATLLGERAVASPASFNNLIGVSKTIFLLSEATRYLVLEMGMNAFGEIKELCENFSPTIGAITNIGDAHQGKLGGVEGVYRAKKELFDYLSLSSSSAIALNADDEKVTRAYKETFGTGCNTVVSYSIHPEKKDSTDVTILKHFIDPTSAFLNCEIQYLGEIIHVQIPIFGLHHAQNIAAAAALASLVNLSSADLRRRLTLLQPAKHRGEVYRIRDSVVLIDESYNSNPSALKSALHSLSKLDPKRRRLLVLGDMREMGEFSQKAHEEVGEKLITHLKNQPHLVIGVGEEIRPLLELVQKKGSKTKHFQTVHDAISAVSSLIEPQDLLLIKGSRGIQLDLLVLKLLEDRVHFEE